MWKSGGELLYVNTDDDKNKQEQEYIFDPKNVYVVYIVIQSI